MQLQLSLVHMQKWVMKSEFLNKCYFFMIKIPSNENLITLNRIVSIELIAIYGYLNRE